MSRTIRQDIDGDAVIVNRDAKGTWVEVEERVAGQAVNVAAAGPLSREVVDDLRKALAPASGRIVIARSIAYPVFAAGPAAWMAGVSWGAVTGPWVGACFMAAVIGFTLVHADD